MLEPDYMRKSIPPCRIQKCPACFLTARLYGVYSKPKLNAKIGTFLKLSTTISDDIVRSYH